MPYQQNIPASTDQLSVSQGDIQGNFQNVKSLIDANHVTFNALGAGKHFKVSLPAQSPAPTFDAGEVGLYSFLNPTTAKNELYINKTNQATVKQIPATASVLSITAAPGSGTAGWTYLPSGILLRWGTISGQTGYAVQTVTGSGFPGFTQILNVQVTPFATGTSDANIAVTFAGIVSNTSFATYVAVRYNSGVAGTGGYTYLAIGY